MIYRTKEFVPGLRINNCRWAETEDIIRGKRFLFCMLTGLMISIVLEGCTKKEEQAAAIPSDDAKGAVSQEQEEHQSTEQPMVSEEEIAEMYEGYQLLWHDEFDGKKLNEDIWNVEEREPGWTNNELQAYINSEENVYLENGNLVLKAVKGKNENGLAYYTSGKVNSKGKKQFLYGKVVARAKVPAGQGLWPAIWMMPQDESFYGQWPKCGEIDIMEILGNQTNVLYSNIHYGLPHGENQGIYQMEKGTFSEDFHEFSLEWEPDEMRFYVDGELFHTVNNWYTAVEGEDEVTYPAPFDQPFFVQMNLAVGGDWPGSPDTTTNFETAEFVVDYVRVYQKSEYNSDVMKPSAMLREPDAEGNYVRNGNFLESEDLEDDVDWKFILLEGGSGSASIENGEMVITSNSAGSQEYSVQLVQPDIPAERGGVYHVTFEAMAEEEREMKVAVTAPEKAWIRYLEDTSLTMGTDWKEYEFEFTMETENDANARLEFNMGNQGSTATIHLRNVRLEKTATVEVKEDLGEKSIQSDGNYVYNGTFQYGEGRLKYWEIEKKLPETLVEVTNKNLIRQLHVQIPAGQDEAVQVIQPELALVGDTMYNLTFDAYGDSGQTMQAQVGSQSFEFELTEQLNNYSFSFTLEKEEARPSLIFFFGDKGNMYLDNVKIKEDGALINASFSNGFTGWTPFVDNSIEAEVSYAVDSLTQEDAAGFTINNTGGENWMIQLMQKNISLYKGKSYTLSFDAKCSVERSIECAAQRDGSQDDVWTEYGKGSFALSPDYQTYTLEFEMTEENNLDAMITFSMGAVDGNVITDSHVIYIDNVVLEEK